MLQDAGYIKNVYLIKGCTGELCGVKVDVAELTMKGHDFLGSIRKESIWRQVKDVVAKAGGNVTLGILENIALKLMEKHVYPFI